MPPFFMKQQVETNTSSRTLAGTLMYPGKWLCTYVLIAGSVWVKIGQERVPG